MNMLLWNCRGVSGKDTVSRIKNMLKNHQIMICCLVETRADAPRILRFVKHLDNGWHWATIPALGFSGGIITFWRKNNFVVTPISRSRYILHMVITGSTQQPWLISTVYNAQRLEDQKVAWAELQGLSDKVGPWIIAGDFNAISGPQDRQGGDFHPCMKSVHFNAFIYNNHLTELNYSGSMFIWCNNQSGLARRWARLDRLLVNHQWLETVPNYAVKHLPRSQSDHNPVLLQCSFERNRGTRPFRFNNSWIQSDLCLHSVTSI
ncbi:hypothetical protein J5N97_005384 [Dioscorea zingiberensis]|uniref:Endonuclease/exonuclease/phosphatase domain-containing protein n=1 Tax=Dioscorea zingiberensis TaxID=325984 RepID=A0A9D5D8C4_9LILI|nr:hypothetical protein J5N97_005384 [Dioscorea zingiberensis]